MHLNYFNYLSAQRMMLSEWLFNISQCFQLLDINYFYNMTSADLNIIVSFNIYGLQVLIQLWTSC